MANHQGRVPEAPAQKLRYRTMDPITYQGNPYPEGLQFRAYTLEQEGANRRLVELTIRGDRVLNTTVSETGDPDMLNGRMLEALDPPPIQVPQVKG